MLQFENPIYSTYPTSYQANQTNHVRRPSYLKRVVSKFVLTRISVVFGYSDPHPRTSQKALTSLIPLMGRQTNQIITRKRLLVGSSEAMESSNQEHEKLPLGCKCSSSSEESSSMAVNYEEDDDTIHRVASFPTSLLRLQQEDYKIDAPHSPLSSNHRDITRANCRLVKYGSLHRRNYRRRRGMKNSYWIITTTVAAAAAVIVSSLLFLSPTTVHAALSCETDEDCETILRPGSTCLESTKTCSNPFQRGCFKTLLPEDERFHMGRICNSDDDDIEVDGSGNDVDRLCYQPDFIYDEIRVHNGT